VNRKVVAAGLTFAERLTRFRVIGYGKSRHKDTEILTGLNEAQGFVHAVEK
jgi:hypothetical protein